MINLTPVFSPSIFFQRKKDILAEMFADKNKYFYQQGRDALRAGLACLKINSNHRVLTPAYLCCEIANIFKELRISIDYYQIFENLLPDFEDLKKKIQSQTKAILMVHFFGFSQPILEFQQICRQSQLNLIEDCAHAFGSQYHEHFLGNFGDLAFFSPRKVLALPDGGILITPKKITLTNLTPTKTRTRALASLLLDRLIFSCGWSMLKALKKIGANKNKFLNASQAAPLAISRLSQNLWQRANWQKIAQQRRKNYLYLAARLKGVSDIKLIYPELPKNTVPYVLPLITKNRQYRKKLQSYNISAQPWPELPTELDSRQFKTTFYLAKNTLLLPIHQSLNQKKLDLIVAAFK